ncbi:hypothetical protein [Flavobacterium sp. 2]|uniref:hypothetical protein n=1 Tax=Flavobacterium sp. 2 TaxID=308053 RepID=UPI003CED301A
MQGMNSKLKVAEYVDPLLVLVLLRFAQNCYGNVKIIQANSLPINPSNGKLSPEARDISLPRLMSGIIYVEQLEKIKL